MKIPEFLDDLNIISKLGDNPGADNGLTAEGLKAKFDEGALTIQQYLNGVLIATLNQIFAAGGQLNEGLIMTGPINMNQQMLFGLKNPVNESEPVSLGFAIANYAPKSHVEDTNNPHKSTAEQVGAVPTSRTINGKALSEDIDLTAGDVGAAPIGYGLGHIAYNLPEVTNANDAVYNGWYLLGKDTANGFGYRGVMRVDAYSTTQVLQTLYTQGYSTQNPVIVQRACVGGTWSAWAHVNPLMGADVEYRTTELHNGKTVFAKLVNFGAMPNATGKTVAYRGNGSTGVVSLTAMLSDGCCVSGGVCMDRSFSNVDTFSLDSTKYNVRITTASNWSSLSAFVLVKYTLD